MLVEVYIIITRSYSGLTNWHIELEINNRYDIIIILFSIYYFYYH